MRRILPHHSATVLKNMRLLHLRLGHFSERKIHESIAAGAKFGPHAEHAQMTDKPHVCTGCLQGKAHKPHKHRHAERGLHPGDLIHCDLKEKVEKSDRGAQYWIHFTDDATRYTEAYALTKKSDAAEARPSQMSRAGEAPSERAQLGVRGAEQ